MYDVTMITDLVDVELIKKQDVQALVLSASLIWIIPCRKQTIHD